MGAAIVATTVALEGTTTLVVVVEDSTPGRRRSSAIYARKKAIQSYTVGTGSMKTLSSLKRRVQIQRIMAGMTWTPTGIQIMGPLTISQAS
jgi:hypothetical protein